MKTLVSSGVSNTQKILWYLVSYGIQNRAFYMVVKQLPEKNYDILQHYGFVSKL
jgi:hypothetical protein